MQDVAGIGMNAIPSGRAGFSGFSFPGKTFSLLFLPLHRRFSLFHMLLPYPSLAFILPSLLAVIFYALALFSAAYVPFIILPIFISSVFSVLPQPQIEQDF